MKKRPTSERNPQGVEYPEAVKADGTLVSAIEIEKGNSEWEGVKFYFPGCEGDDEEEMLFIPRKHKNGVTKFFRHRPCYIGDRNEPDRYLHNYAELRLKQRFDESKKSGMFPVKYYQISKCPHYQNCKLKKDINCKGEPKAILKELNLLDSYDTCTIEKGEDKYIADLLLTNSQDDSIKPMFLEVYVTHKCTDEKIASGFPIIELKIENKEDADNDIVENSGEVVDEYLFMQSENSKRVAPIVFYGFKRETDFNDYVQYANFTIVKNEDDLIADYCMISCDGVEDYSPHNRILSLSIPYEKINGTDFYEVGMAVARSKGIEVRDCTLCNKYKIPSWQKNSYDVRSCRLIDVTFKTKDKKGRDLQLANPYLLQLPYRCNGFDKSKQAAGCQRYRIDMDRIIKIVYALDNSPKRLWIDDCYSLKKQTTIEKPMERDNAQTKTDDVLDERWKPQSECSEYGCPIYRKNCGHHLDTKLENGKEYVLCDWEDPKRTNRSF